MSEELKPINTEGQITFRIEEAAIQRDVESALALPPDMLFAPMTSRVMCANLDWRSVWQIVLS